jgi:hypothetical protein
MPVFRNDFLSDCAQMVKNFSIALNFFDTRSSKAFCVDGEADSCERNPASSGSPGRAPESCKVRHSFSAVRHGIRTFRLRSLRVECRNRTDKRFRPFCDRRPIFCSQDLIIDQRIASDRGHRTDSEEFRNGRGSDATDGDECDVGQRLFERLNIGGSELVAGENLDRARTGAVPLSDFRTGERAADYGHVVSSAQRDHIRPRRWSDDEAGSGKNSEPRGFNIQHGAEAEMEFRESRTRRFERGDRAGCRQREFETVDATASERTGAIDQIVADIGADQADQSFGADLGKKCIFLHVGELCDGLKQRETNFLVPNVDDTIFW